MLKLRRALFILLLVPALLLISVQQGSAQVISAFSLTWNNSAVSELVQGDCYDLDVDVPGATLDILWSLGDGPIQRINGWPTVDDNGRAENICTSSTTPVGPIIFRAISISGTENWIWPGYWLTVWPQAANADFNVPSGYAGVDHYVFTAYGVGERPVRIRYNFRNVANLLGVIWVDGAGHYSSEVFDHYSAVGQYVITGVSDAQAQEGNWTEVYAPFEILPPQPHHLSLNKPSIAAGGANGTAVYRMEAVNGADMNIDFRYRIGTGGLKEIINWPWLAAINFAPIWLGRSYDITASKCTTPGDYEFVSLRNTLNAEWIPVSPSVHLNVVGAGEPSLASVSPQIANRGESVTVTLTGQNLCGLSQITTNYSGLTFSNLNNPNESDGTSLTATFNIAPNAAAGNARVTFYLRNGTLDVYFGIRQNGQAVPTVADISPRSGTIGSSVSVTITGTNLILPGLSASWNGLTITNVVPASNGNSLTATLMIAGNAQAGNPPLTITTPIGFVTNSSFAIEPAFVPPILAREYIYLGGRVIAVEAP